MSKKQRCPRCGRLFWNLNLHDKLSRCGRVAGIKPLGAGDEERIAKVGVDIAIKKRKKF